MASKVAGNIFVPVWVDDRVVKALVDDTGRIHVHLDSQESSIDVNLKTSDITLGVTESAPLSDIQAQAYEYTGAAWVKKREQLAYIDTFRERKSNLSAAAGSNSLVHTVVAADEVWIIENISVWNANTAVTYIQIYLTSGGASYTLKRFTTPAANVPDTYTQKITLGVGDSFTILFAGCILNDDIYSDVVGYKMKAGI